MNTTRLPFVVVAVVCALFGIHLVLSSRGEAALQRGQSELAAERYPQALAELEDLDGEAGGRAAATRGRAYVRLGRLAEARAALQSAVRRDPNNWVLQREYAGVLLQLGERAKARARMSRAKALNPRMLLPPGFVDAR